MPRSVGTPTTTPREPTALPRSLQAMPDPGGRPPARPRCIRNEGAIMTSRSTFFVLLTCVLSWPVGPSLPGRSKLGAAELAPKLSATVSTPAHPCLIRNPQNVLLKVLVTCRDVADERITG